MTQYVKSTNYGSLPGILEMTLGEKITLAFQIAMISPGQNFCENTLNTLRYADRVKELKTLESKDDRPRSNSNSSSRNGNNRSNGPSPLATPKVGEPVGQAGRQTAGSRQTHSSIVAHEQAPARTSRQTESNAARSFTHY